jgi:hypothetical protein
MLDRISVSVLQLRLEAIVQEMGEAMLRTAYSQILNSNRDFSTAVCDGEGRLTAQAEHVPIHVGAMPWAVHSIREFFRGRIRPGDMFLLNDPYHGGNHLPDLTVLLPVFMGECLVFWSINRAHQSDIGGATHGAYNPGATEIWQEGIRITPLKLYDRGELRDDVLHMLATNMRHARDFLGDLRAMIGSASRDAVDQPLCAGGRRSGDQGAGPGVSGTRRRRLVPTLQDRHQGHKSTYQSTLHLAYVPRSWRWWGLAGWGRLADRGRGAGGWWHQIRQHRGDRGPLPLVLEAA